MNNVKSKIISTLIDGYKLEFDDINYGGTTQVTVYNGRFVASLEYVKASGCVYNPYSGEEKQIPDSTILKFESWAEKVGY